LLSAKLELRQAQSLVITPQLQQAIKLLQLSNLELQTFLEHEIEQNPLIEWDERTSDEPADKITEVNGEASATDTSDSDIAVKGDDASAAAAEMGSNLDDADFGPIGAYESLSLRTPSGSASDGDASLENYVAQEVNLRDHLRVQLHLAVSDPSRRLIGDHLIDLIDEAGYLRGTCGDVAERLGAPLVWTEEVLAQIQSFEPTGVGARTLAECLALQLKERNHYDPAIAKLLDNLELVAAHDFIRLRRICEVDQEDLVDMLAEIRALNPKPGLQFGGRAVDAVVPDILLFRDATGAWVVLLNSETLPRISVNHTYYASAKRGARTDADRAYLQNCISTANWLARSLDQRRQTMLKVAREIVRQQEGFFTHGVRGLKPLSLKDVAERINMHESTVSRVTSNKYMQTPRGTFDLKYFFTSAIAATGLGEAHSSEAVKLRIKELIDAESPKQILSDDKIVEILVDEGMDIARRTVAKYRETMHIPSSVQRRREKNTAHAIQTAANRG
jgi:RNA polymerase sigma-54 factor